MADEDRRQQTVPSLAARFVQPGPAVAPASPPARDPATLPPAAFTVERGADAATLVVVFTGFGGRLAMPAHDFLGVTGLLQASRILLRDASRTLFLDGIPPFAPGLDALLDKLRAAIAELAPARTLFLGNSGGSHAAILFGHLAGADVVHAFAPFTNLDPAHIRATGLEGRLQRHGDVVAKLDALPAPVRRYLDLREVLASGNGRTRFHVHACAQSPAEMRRAAHLEGLPGVTVHRHPCDSHMVAVWLARNELLTPLLRDSVEA